MKEYTVKTQITGKAADNRMMYDLADFGNVHFKDNAEVLYDMRQIVLAETEPEAITKTEQDIKRTIADLQGFSVTELNYTKPEIVGVHETEFLNTDAFYRTEGSYEGYTIKPDAIIFEMPVYATDNEQEKLASRIAINKDEGIENFIISVEKDEDPKLFAYIIKREEEESFAWTREIPLSPAEQKDLESYLEATICPVKEIQERIKTYETPIDTSKISFEDTSIQYMEIIGMPYLYTNISCEPDFAKELIERTVDQLTANAVIDPQFYIQSEDTPRGFRSVLYLKNDEDLCAVQMSKQVADIFSDYVKVNIDEAVFAEYQNRLYEFENPNYDSYENNRKDTYDHEI